MYDRILFPTDGSDAATAALDYALDVASAHDATVHLLNVADTSQESLTRIRGEVIDVLEREGEDVVAEAATRATERGLSAVTDVLQGVPHETIADYCERRDIDLVVMATHGRSGLERFLLGSVTERVVNTVTVPVLTVTPGEDREFTYPSRDVLVPTDGSEGAELAVREGGALAAATGGRLHLLHVVETASLGIDVRSSVADDRLEAHANEILDAATETARSASVDDVTGSIAHGRPIREIVSSVEDEGIDLVVLGTQGRTDFSRYILGGVGAKLIRTSPVPVMMVRGPASNRSTDE